MAQVRHLVFAVPRATDRLVKLRYERFEQFQTKNILVIEIAVERPERDVAALRDLGYRGFEIAPLFQQRAPGIQDSGASVTPLRGRRILARRFHRSDGSCDHAEVPRAKRAKRDNGAVRSP